MYNGFILNALLCYYRLLNLVFIITFIVNSHISTITTMENVYTWLEISWGEMGRGLFCYCKHPLEGTRGAPLFE